MPRPRLVQLNSPGRKPLLSDKILILGAPVAREAPFVLPRIES